MQSDTAKNEHHDLLEEEYERDPVPQSKRRSLGSVAAVWFGFPMVLTNAVSGGIIAYSIGFWAGMGAIVVGNVILSLYVGALSYNAGNNGLNFAMQAKRTFGQRGFAIASAFLAIVVIGWYAFQTGFTGAAVHASVGWNALAVTMVAAVLFTAITFIGVNALSVLGMVSAPLYVVLGIVAVCLLAYDQNLGNVLAYGGSSTAGAVSFGGAITLVIATFADSGTMTADFTRWSHNGIDGAKASFTAFPVANMTAQIFGVVIVAAGAAANPAANGGDFTPVLTSHGPVLTAIALLFVFINLGSVATHCLYNGAVGWAHLTGRTMRVLTVILGIVGGIAAIAGIWSLFFSWLNLLGIFVPPIGAVLITDQILFHRSRNWERLPDYRPSAFIGWGLGALAALVIHYVSPIYSEAIVGIVVAALSYYVSTMFYGEKVVSEAA